MQLLFILLVTVLFSAMQTTVSCSIYMIGAVHPSFLLSEQNLSRAAKWSSSSCPQCCSYFCFIEGLHKLESRASVVLLTGFISLIFLRTTQTAVFQIAISCYPLSWLSTEIAKSLSQMLLPGAVSLAFFLALCALSFSPFTTCRTLNSFTLINFQFVGSHT